MYHIYLQAMRYEKFLPAQGCPKKQIVQTNNDAEVVHWFYIASEKSVFGSAGHSSEAMGLIVNLSPLTMSTLLFVNFET